MKLNFKYVFIFTVFVQYLAECSFSMGTESLSCGSRSLCDQIYRKMGHDVVLSVLEVLVRVVL